jgi:hypothetical protein
VTAATFAESDARFAEELESAHRRGVRAAAAGLQDAALGAGRLTGDGVPALAEAAVTSATPFLRAPLLSRIGRVAKLHPPRSTSGTCPTCGVPAPCATVQALL